MQTSELGWALGAFAAAAILSNLIIRWLLPALSRRFMASETDRSLHSGEIPEGGGIGVASAVIAVLGAVNLLFGHLGSIGPLLNAVFLLTVVGVLDDSRALSKLGGFWAAVRLLLYLSAVITAFSSLQDDARIVLGVPVFLEECILAVGIVAFINFVNFMDGMDWMTLVEVLPTTAALFVLGWLGVLPFDVAIAAVALAGAMVGFAPYNKPVAKIFLGDAGSLPIGLLLGWLLLRLAAEGYRAAAVLLVLYYLADTIITLIWRFWRGERIWQAHRSHFYQVARLRGAGVLQVTGTVLLLNVVLAVLAISTVVCNDWRISTGALLAGGAAVALVLLVFNRTRGVGEPRSA
jgi:UDP-N-acetylmuramyl pentapeptide phosphotransferase/UDP-N-acetylglucosamine-1-phosphate transferase